MKLNKFIKKERKIWHERFVPSLIAAVAVLVITFILQLGRFDIVLLTSISASIVILTSQKLHQLTILGTTIYAYIIGALTGFFFLFLEAKLDLSLVIVSFLTITTISILIYIFDIVHPPAIGIALGIGLFKGAIRNLIFILILTMIMFVVVKFVMYLYYDHMKLKIFHHEFLIWKKKLSRKSTTTGEYTSGMLASLGSISDPALPN